MKEDKELKKKFVEILHKNGILEATKELKQSLFGSLYDAYNLDRPTPPVETKTAEEILGERVKSWCHIGETDTIDYDTAIKAIHSYHAQFTPSAKSESTRFEIELSGKPFLGFETEAHITDDQNPTCTIIVKSGYATIKETLEYANKILKILNNGSL